MTAVVEVAVGILIRDGAVLLCHRHPLRLSYPDVWDFPGGHIDVGETPDEALVRELKEELGVEAATPAGTWRVVDGDDSVRLHFYIVREWKGDVVNAEPSEHDAMAWFEPGEIGQLVLAHDSYRQLILEATAV